MDDTGYVAFDRVSGQPCKTFQLNLAKSSCLGKRRAIKFRGSHS